jgi:hypothetical protein
MLKRVLVGLLLLCAGLGVVSAQGKYLIAYSQAELVNAWRVTN